MRGVEVREDGQRETGEDTDGVREDGGFKGREEEDRMMVTI